MKEFSCPVSVAYKAKSHAFIRTALIWLQTEFRSVYLIRPAVPFSFPTHKTGTQFRLLKPPWQGSFTKFKQVGSINQQANQSNFSI